MDEIEAIRMEPDFLRHAMEGGLIVLGGLAVLTLSSLLFITWAFLAFRRRRLYPRLGGLTLGLALLGYLTYDWQHILLNISMRDADKVRQECVGLLQRRTASVPDESPEMHLHGAEVPESLQRLGATYVRVTCNNVQISVIPYSPLTGSAWGFLYDPNQAYLTDRWPDDIRPTWYRDFYEFRVYGE